MYHPFKVVSFPHLTDAVLNRITKQNESRRVSGVFMSRMFRSRMQIFCESDSVTAVVLLVL